MNAGVGNVGTGLAYNNGSAVVITGGVTRRQFVPHRQVRQKSVYVTNKGVISLAPYQAGLGSPTHVVVDTVIDNTTGRAVGAVIYDAGPNNMHRAFKVGKDCRINAKRFFTQEGVPMPASTEVYKASLTASQPKAHTFDGHTKELSLYF